MDASFKCTITRKLLITPACIPECDHVVDLEAITTHFDIHPNHCPLPNDRGGQALTNMRLTPLPELNAKIEKFVLDQLKQKPETIADNEIRQYLAHHPKLDVESIPEVHTYLDHHLATRVSFNSFKEIVKLSFGFTYGTVNKWQSWLSETADSLERNPPRFYQLERLMLFSLEEACAVWAESPGFNKDEVVNALKKLYEEAAAKFAADPEKLKKAPEPIEYYLIPDTPFQNRMGDAFDNICQLFSIPGILGMAAIDLVVTYAIGWEAEAWLSALLINLLGCYGVAIVALLFWGFLTGVGSWIMS
jgi:hypothetical protein